jgi:hypothetical protein
MGMATIQSSTQLLAYNTPNACIIAYPQTSMFSPVGCGWFRVCVQRRSQFPPQDNYKETVIVNTPLPLLLAFGFAKVYFVMFPMLS